MRDLAFNTAFIGNNLTYDDMAMIHRSIMDVRAESLRRTLTLLVSIRHHTASAQRLKRNSQHDTVTANYRLPLPYFLRNESQLPDSIYLPIDDRGNLKKQRCPSSEGDALDLNRISPSYRRTMDLANKSFPATNLTRTFGFKVHKPNYGHEYHIHFVREAPTPHTVSQTYQLITAQQYNRPRITKKYAVKLETVAVVLVTIPSKETNPRYLLDSAAKTMTTLRQFGVRCILLLSYCDNEGHLNAEDIVRNYDDRNISVRLINNGTLLEEISRYDDDWIFVHLSDGVMLQAGYLLRCSLYVQSGLGAYFPIPLLRRGHPGFTDHAYSPGGFTWHVDYRDRWDSSSYHSYCIGVADAKRVAKTGCDVTNGFRVFNAVKNRLQIRRSVEGNLERLKPAVFGHQCQKID